MKRFAEPTELRLMLKKVTLLLFAFFLLASYTGDASFVNTDSSLKNAKLLEQ